MKKLFSFFAAMLVAFAANATVINITNETPDALRTALNSAADGDEIVMAAGTYVESNSNYIAFDGKAVTVKAAEDANVIIQPQVPITVSNGGHAIFENVKIDASRLQELATWYEHLLYVMDDQPNGCTFRGCEIYGYAVNNSMFYCSNANKVAAIKFDNCFFHNINKSILFIENTAGKPMVQVLNSTFANVIASVTDSYWAGIIDIRAAEATLKVDKCTFYNVVPMNTDYSAVSKIALAKGTVSNCIFMLPTALDNIRAMRGVTATNCITFNYLKDSGTGIHSSVTQTNCVQVDPAFVDPDNNNFTLSKTSPAMTMNDGQPIGDPRWIPSEEPAEPQTLYLKPGVWNTADPAVKFAVWDITNSKWTAFMTLAEKETDVYTTTVDANVKKVIFVRLNGALEAPDWGEGKSWNQTADLDLEEGKDLWTVTDWSAGAWSKYVYEEPAKFYITGNEALVGEKAWDGKAVKSTADSYIFENLAAGNYKLKVVDGENWKGYSALTAEGKAPELYPDPDGNICFNLAAAGNVTVTYTSEVFKVEGPFVPATVQLIGIQGEGEAAWDASKNAVALIPAEDKLTGSVILTLTGWYYEFKLIVDGAWLGKQNEDGLYTLWREHTAVEGLTYAGGNIKLTMDEGDIVPGNYKFTWTYATGKLEVTFPKNDPTAIDNTDAAIKAVKMVQNGQLFIIKNDKTYNAQGQLVK